MNFKDKADVLIAARKSLSTQLPALVEQLKDTSIPLADRWQVYTDLVNTHILTKKESYGDGFLHELGQGVRELTQYDDFHNDRGATVKFIDMYDHIMEADGEWQEDLVAVREDGSLPLWQEKVLASGYASFTYDW